MSVCLSNLSVLRDLHWGNVCLSNLSVCLTCLSSETSTGVMCWFSPLRRRREFPPQWNKPFLRDQGVSVRIIDYSLSRLEIDGLTVSCDISEDEELFQGHGDLQFDIYRLMRQENGNKWGDYQPHSNVLWLHYLSSKLLTMTYKSRGGRGVKQARLDLQRFHDDVLTFRSASDILYNCGLFQ
ncbi:serine/threonine-protein kinase haspin-like isoform X1 [Oncorhynchus keta]|uniref:serine/threonine-protein kinase haspin-like isoform X1 n=2 Tax=Oncorhynchus keta TaxID=8018 RepID=UPI00227A183A|nr:serine/threonine-protein kinase haspin-like isoform X1 [Oncorhynchus keta]